MNIVHNLRNLKKNFITFEEFRLFSRILILIPLVEVSVKFFSIPRLMDLMTPKKIKHNSKFSENYLIEKTTKYTDFLLGLNFWMYKPKCLRRSLVIYRVLREAALDIYICFGARLNDENNNLSNNRLEGHAWLIKDGNVFLEKDQEIAKTYKMTYCFPNSEASTSNSMQ